MDLGASTLCWRSKSLAIPNGVSQNCCACAAERRTKKGPICAAALNTCLLPAFFAPFSSTPDGSSSQLAAAMHGPGSPLPQFVSKMLQASARCGSFAMLTAACLCARLSTSLSLVPSYADQVRILFFFHATAVVFQHSRVLWFLVP